MPPRPGDPPPELAPKPIWQLLVLLIALGIATPFALRYYRNSQLQKAELGALERVKDFARQQKSYFEKKGEYAGTFQELGGDWVAVQDMDSPKPSDIDGYRFRILKSQGWSAKDGSKSFVDDKNRIVVDIGLLAAPTKYGYTANHTFLLGGGSIYYKNFGPHTDMLTTNLTEFVIPPGAGKIE